MKLFLSLIMLAAFLLFLIAAWLVPEPLRGRLGWTGAACVTLVWLITHWPE